MDYKLPYWDWFVTNLLYFLDFSFQFYMSAFGVLVRALNLYFLFLISCVWLHVLLMREDLSLNVRICFSFFGYWYTFACMTELLEVIAC